MALVKIGNVRAKAGGPTKAQVRARKQSSKETLQYLASQGNKKAIAALARGKK